GSRAWLQPGYVFRHDPRGGADDLAGHRADLDVFPIRSGVMPAGRLAVRKRRGDRLAKYPGERAASDGLALVDLRAFGMQREHRGFTWSCDGLGKRGLGGCADERPGEKDGSEYGVLGERHGNAPSLVLHHCELTGRANARPTTGSEQSIVLQAETWIVRRSAPRNDVEGVVKGGLRRHRLGEVVRNLVEEAGGGQP